VGQTIAESVRPNGLVVRRVRVPIGVIAMIYEARPNVTADASALCLKAGNAVVLRGGSEAERSNAAIARVIGDALERAKLPRDAVVRVPATDRESIKELVAQTEFVDLVIPRGGEALIRFVSEHARVPVIQHFKGVCHLFVDRGADVDAATRLAVNGKLSRPGVCNALECLLVDAGDAERLLPPIARALIAGGAELRGCERTRALVPDARAAGEGDWGFEFLDKVLAARVVDGIDGALAHVARYGSGHTEAICTRDRARAERWRREVDAACVIVNASTRFHDGGELGLGAEIGIATSRIHWRGAMGLESLTTMKWIVDGEGQVRS
jgi:glutamate-5-semialdehyde dehydrogenase